MIVHRLDFFRWAFSIGRSMCWNWRIMRTSSWNDWSTFILNLALHSIRGMRSWRARFWASSRPTWSKRDKWGGVTSHHPPFKAGYLNSLHLQLGDSPSLTYSPPLAWGTRRGPSHAEFVDETWSVRRTRNARSRKTRAENLLRTSCTALASRWILLDPQYRELCESRIEFSTGAIA